MQLVQRPESLSCKQRLIEADMAVRLSWERDRSECELYYMYVLICVCECVCETEQAEAAACCRLHNRVSIGNGGHSCLSPLEHKPIRDSVIWPSFCFMISLHPIGSVCFFLFFVYFVLILSCRFQI